MSITFEDLREGLAVDDAIRAFTDGCQTPGGLWWINDRWLQPRLERLRECLTSPLTQEQAAMLRSVALMQVQFDPVLDWLSEAPTTPWAIYAQRNQARRQHQRGTGEWEERQAKCEYAEWECVADQSRLQRLILQWYPTFQHIAIEPTPEKTPASQYAAEANACPTCGRRPDALTWTHMRVFRVARPRDGGTWEGWITVCTECKRRVDRFTENEWIS